MALPPPISMLEQPSKRAAGKTSIQDMAGGKEGKKEYSSSDEEEEDMYMPTKKAMNEQQKRQVLVDFSESNKLNSVLYIYIYIFIYIYDYLEQS